MYSSWQKKKCSYCLLILFLSKKSQLIRESSNLSIHNMNHNFPGKMNFIKLYKPHFIQFFEFSVSYKSHTPFTLPAFHSFSSRTSLFHTPTNPSASSSSQVSLSFSTQIYLWIWRIWAKTPFTFSSMNLNLWFSMLDFHLRFVKSIKCAKYSASRWILFFKHFCQIRNLSCIFLPDLC